jgi:D-alanyl-D-alanine carboxypeptidase
MRPPVAAFAAALALSLQMSGFALGRQGLPHPGFTLTLRELSGLVAGLPEQARTAITARPSDFLELMRGVLAGPQDLFVLVDKTHSLTADFVPPDLVSLSRSGIRASRSDMQLREILIADLLAMSEAASTAGAPLVVSSAWRSFKYQEGLFARALERQPLEEVEMTLARPGHSQHQLGTAIDFGSIDISFADTRQGKWLFTHASSFGFSLSYPRGMEGSTGYSWEPWHYRYMGRGAARLIDEFFGGMQQDFLALYARNGAVFSRKLRR